MSGSQLATNWICIATAGETVDKRTIEEQWLLDAAELYDPNLYTALLWPEHTRNFGNMGEVLEVKAERDDEGILRLYARLCPAIALLQANAKGQLLFLSPEFTPDGNFRNTGKTYLEGLAITDSPAGVSTTRLRFSRTKGKRIGPYKPLAFDEVREFKREKGMSKAKKGWRHFFSIEEPEQTTEPDPVPSDAMQALADALAALEDRVTAIETRLDTAEEAVSDVQDDVETVKDVVDTEDFARLVGNLPELVKGFSKLDAKVTKLPNKQFSKGKKGFNFL
ncbi:MULTISPECIES: GPO family capsid scaffolding protein [unclassified Pseudocitrobacter]|uniref:GPO family capsid scaffolding protein n=1 Tax=unclassified Pseudocitrobacter TaxID=2638778 RepID=UPI001F0E2742|nr:MULTISPECIES: GPO family capsid scaffolding protein [Enterobacteriaceae]MCH5360163.1 GPO family capsid scaffolding protein [Escherichia fergusonii]MDF3826916.1 GPO family capsid scaffolding protein [Pseudocitrobacter sp. 2023EL-00150]MEC5375688.1 GPO family capsid scaffolding protein [Pseudocitrobacter sp. MW920760]